jgi:hypothetical protein
VPATVTARLQHLWGYEFDRWIAARLQPSNVEEEARRWGVEPGARIGNVAVMAWNGNLKREVVVRVSTPEAAL